MSNPRTRNSPEGSWAWWLGLALLGGTLAAPGALAADVCLSQLLGVGIGGTGAVAAGTGMGGTGAVAQGVGVGGTGAVAQGTGIGGTGAVAQGGGIGGTGSVADGKGIGGTGIVGVITGFASVCVNGVEVQYDQGTPIAQAGTGPLAIGQVVAIEAAGDGVSLHARRITVLHAVSGPVSSADAGRLQVLGHTVRVLPSTIGGESAAGMRPGDAVQVSGLRLANGEIVASRIDRGPQDLGASLWGRVTRVGEDGFAVQGVEIVSAGGLPRDVALGREVVVAGNWDGKRLVASRVSVAPAAPFEGRVERLMFQGFVGDTGAGQALRVGDLDVVPGERTVYSGGTASDLKRDRPVIVSGRLMGDGKLSADEVRVLTGIMPRGSPRAELGPAVKGDPGRSDIPGTEDRPDRAERPEKVERPERPEKVERPERPEKVERPERPEGSGGRGK